MASKRKTYTQGLCQSPHEVGPVKVGIGEIVEYQVLKAPSEHQNAEADRNAIEQILSQRWVRWGWHLWLGLIAPQFNWHCCLPPTQELKVLRPQAD
jgi:hypothetical protein